MNKLLLIPMALSMVQGNSFLIHDENFIKKTVMDKKIKWNFFKPSYTNDRTELINNINNVQSSIGIKFNENEKQYLKDIINTLNASDDNFINNSLQNPEYNIMEAKLFLIEHKIDKELERLGQKNFKIYKKKLEEILQNIEKFMNNHERKIDPAYNQGDLSLHKEVFNRLNLSKAIIEISLKKINAKIQGLNSSDIINEKILRAVNLQLKLGINHQMVPSLYQVFDELKELKEQKKFKK